MILVPLYIAAVLATVIAIIAMIIMIYLFRGRWLNVFGIIIFAIFSHFSHFRLNEQKFPHLIGGVYHQHKRADRHAHAEEKCTTRKMKRSKRV